MPDETERLPGEEKAEEEYFLNLPLPVPYWRSLSDEELLAAVEQTFRAGYTIGYHTGEYIGEATS